jgi:hypothetical protein
MADICSITASQQAASDAAAKNALDNSKGAGTQSKLEQMQAHTQAAMKDWMAGGQLIVVPPNITKKHDVINFLLGQGLKGQAVVDKMAGLGFKIKVADVNSNIKWYGTAKIPANFPKAGTMPAIEGQKIVDILPPKPTFTPPPIKPPAPSPTIQSLTEQTPEEKFIMHKQVGPQAGSNPGGMYEDMDGKKWYVKLYAEEGQGIGEHVSNAIYRRLGVGAPESKLFKQANGKTAFASKVLENEGTIEKVGLTKERADKILDGFAADVLTANWDAVGLSLDNVVVLNKLDNILVRIDQGGSLLYRAKGALKPNDALGVLSEWTSFAPGGKNPAYAKVFNAAGIQKAEDLGEKLIKQIEDIKTFRANLGPGGYRAFIESLGVSPTHSLKLANMLESRTNGLIAKAEQIKGAAKEAEELKKLMTQAEQNGLVHLPFTSSYQLKIADNLMVVQDNYYSGIKTLMSKPPEIIINAGPEAITKWYTKHLPAATKNQIQGAITNLKQSASSLKIEQWIVEEQTGKAIPTLSAAKPGFAVEEQAAGMLDRRNKDLRGRIGDSSVEALRSYGGSGYGAINSALRSGESAYFTKPAGRIRAIDSAMNKSKLDVNAVLYRGLGSTHPLERMSLPELQKAIGSEFTELGYGSHSTAMHRAQGFASGNRIIRFQATADVHGIWMRGAGVGVHTEQEFLVHRSSRFKITNVSASGDSIVIDVELLAQEAVTLKNVTKAAATATELKTAATPLPIGAEPPYYINKKHDLINFYLGKGLDGQDVVNVMSTKGFKIKVADVNANKKYYGTDKIPGKYQKASEVLKEQKVAPDSSSAHSPYTLQEKVANLAEATDSSGEDLKNAFNQAKQYGEIPNEITFEKWIDDQLDNLDNMSL